MKKPNSDGARRRSAARLAAVQALYQIDMSEAAVDVVLRQFPREDGEPGLAEPDGELFTKLVRGVVRRLEDIDPVVGGALSGDWTVERLEAILKSILRLAVFELLELSDVPSKVVISEYLNIAHAFYAGPEPGMVNAVLDRVSRILREGEFPADGAR
jgi:N utilization substance protein B